jgi:hypothetical protein
MEGNYLKNGWTVICGIITFSALPVKNPVISIKILQKISSNGYGVK